MCSKKRDLEIICNLEWKTRPQHGVETSNIIGVYDVPSTTLNWEIFKSYLLKNSGTPGDDVRVSYLATNEKEFPIQSQLDFQIALYVFRKKARNGEMVNLKLDRISAKHSASTKPTSNDVETQSDADGACAHSMINLDKAPEWFTTYMTEFKKQILHEVSTTVSNCVSSIKPHGVQSYYHSRKSKTESTKRSRKHPSILCDLGHEKEILKTIKLERKVESKLEKLENKSKKLKEKKMSLLTKSSDSEAGQSSSKSNSDTFLNVDISLMNAAPIRHQQSVIPHMIGGEVYLHTWEVINNGKLPWTSDTELHFTWGSALLEPVEKIVPCPLLQPGESGSINVLMNVPKVCGHYESYWYFHHKGRKFGQWLGFHIIVDKINSAEPFTKSFLNSYEEIRSKYDSDVSPIENKVDWESSFRDILNENIFEVISDVNSHRDTNPVVSPAVPIIEEKMKDLQMANASPNPQSNGSSLKSTEDYFFVTQEQCSSPSNSPDVEVVTTNQKEIETVVLNASPSKIQIVEKFPNDLTLTGSSSSHPENNGDDVKQSCPPEQTADLALDSDGNNTDDSSSESIRKIDEDTTSNSTMNDMVIINYDDELEDNISGYAYVSVDGLKVPIPKKYLRSDFLETAEDAPDPSHIVKITNCVNEVSETTKVQENDSTSHNICQEDSKPETSSSNDVTPYAPETTQSKGGVIQVDYKFLSEEAKRINDEVCSPTPIADFSNKAGEQMSIIGTQYSITNEEAGDNKFLKCNIYKMNPSETELQQCHEPEDASKASFASHTSNSAIFHDTHQNLGDSLTNSIKYPHVPNYQQTLPEMRPKLKREETQPTVEPQEYTHIPKTPSYSFTCSSGNTYTLNGKEEQPNGQTTTQPPMASVVSGAMNMACSAINTAKNVVTKIIPPRNENEEGEWINGHWFGNNPNSPREANLRSLAEMGFWDRNLNATLLARYNDDIVRVVSELIQ